MISPITNTIKKRNDHAFASSDCVYPIGRSLAVASTVFAFYSVGFLDIDGRPSFAKRSIDDDKQVKIAAIDPDFKSRPQPWSLMEYAGRHLITLTSFSLCA